VDDFREGLRSAADYRGVLSRSAAVRRTAEPALVRTGAAIYLGAGAIGTLQAAIPGGTPIALAPALAATLIALPIWLLGGRVPRPILFLLAPLGIALIAQTMASSPGTGDAAILYAWPVLWVGCFYGARTTALTVLTVAVAHGVALMTMSDGSFDRWCDVTVSVAVIAGVVRTLAARNERLVARLTAESRLDPLTGVLNRRGLAERFDAEVARALRERRPLAVVAIDIDHFKRINDTFGHDAGDRSLIWLANLLCAQTRGSDLIARTGGEEFLLVLPGADLDSASEFAERLRHAVAAGDPPVALTISAGVAAEAAPSTPAALTQAADAALYDAKREGRDRVAAAG
jgi:diguanylate cyclase (GGDEF)-like protein